jgi:hypothetical protein
MMPPSVAAAPGLNNSLALLLIALFATIGVYLVVNVWLPRPPRVIWLWIVGWNVFVMLMFLGGIVGVRETLANPPQLAFSPRSPWVPSLGIVVCGLGIVAAWVGAAVLARAEREGRAQGDASALPTRSLAKE